MDSLKFHGNGTEYFKIWIVNILLTIITLGIYHPWAKVRSRRYFYGNTHLNNANFEYHATGKQLFIGFAISIALLITYAVLSQINPSYSAAFLLLLMLVTPWIVWRSIRFNMRMISYRNVRFGFKGSAGGSYITFLAYPLGMILALVIVIAVFLGILKQVSEVAAGILTAVVILAFYPVFFAVFNKLSTNYLTNNAHFGQGKFVADLEYKPFLVIMLKAMGIGLVLSFAALILFGVLAYFTFGFDQILQLSGELGGDVDSAAPNTSLLLLLVAIYPVLIAIGLYVSSYLKARHRTYLFNQTTLDNSVRFDSTLRVNTLFAIHLTNLLFVIFTLGLAYPWAKVRAHRYLTESIRVKSDNGLDGYISQRGAEGALGEELGDAFDIDVGGIAF